MLTDHIGPDQENEESSASKGRTRAIVWDYFEKITGDDGLPKTRCTNCNKVYCSSPNSGTSTMRRHLRKCSPHPLAQLIPPQPTPRSRGELANEARASKKLKSVMVDDLQAKTDRELMEFIWMNKRNIGLLEQKLPDKAIAIKEAVKCYEDEIDRRAKLNHPKENGAGPVTSLVPVKIEADDLYIARYGNVEENMAEDGNVVGSEITETHADVNQKTRPQLENGNLVKKFEVGDQSVARNEIFDGPITEEEREARLQIVAVNQTSIQQTAISVLPEDISTELRKVSSVLSLLNSPNDFYTPQGNPLDQEAEQAKQSLAQLLNKDFETIVGSPEEQKVKSCIEMLTKNLHKLPIFQGRVIETLNTEFDCACQNWSTFRANIETHIAFEMQQGDNLEFLKEWQEKDMELESELVKVDADIVRLRDELREKELTRESLVKQKLDLFDQSKFSIDEAKEILQAMVTSKLQSDVAIDNMKEIATKWEKIRENFNFK